jgi:hypothetical protein
MNLNLAKETESSIQKPEKELNIDKLVFPIHIGVEPMKRLIVASFKNDPEIEMIEPQLFDDEINGKGLRVLMYRKDKKVDVYWQKGVVVDLSTFNIGDGIGEFMETKICPAQFMASETGIDLDVEFEDAKGRVVKLLIKEKSKSKKTFPFLAPVGNDIQNPRQLFFAFMNEFDFVKKNGTVFEAKIGDRVLMPESFPIPRDFKKVFFTRYALNPVVGTFNPPANKPLIIHKNEFGLTKTCNMNLFLDKNHSIEHIWVNDGNSMVKIDFADNFPDLNQLNQMEKVEGRWKYSVCGHNLTKGNYNLFRKNDEVSVEFNVTGNWNPRKIPFSFWVFTAIVKSFRTWPTTYQWNGTVNLNDLSMQGSWKRIEKNRQLKP